MLELFLAAAAIIFLAIYLWSHRPDPRLPPFPRTPLPIVGNLFHLEEDSRKQFKTWRKQCGDIFSVNAVGTQIVVLNGFDVIKEALVKKADYFSDRPPVFFDEATGFPGKGVMFSSGHNWKENRSVALTILRQFGMGKNILAEKIQEEVSAYVDFLASKKGQPVDIKIFNTISSSNIICSIIIGHRFEYDDSEFQKMIGHLNSLALEQTNTSLINFISWLKYLPGDLFKAKKLTRSTIAIFQMLQKFVREKGCNTVESEDAEHFIQAYQVERNKKQKTGASTELDDDSLAKVIMDLFDAGTETTSTTMYWFVLYMLNYPDVQEKVYTELKEVIGTERLPNMQDRSQMPYLNAAILETQRLGSIVPLSLPHKCAEDVTLRGYLIPKGTLVIPNLDSVLHDKALWGEDVMTFKPERFLDANGKVQDREELIPFGIGRRLCLGDAMAKMELFLFATNLVQRFHFVPKDKRPPNCNDYVAGLACAPVPYEVRLVERI
jgi:cytochrome P450 family 2 subfamily J